jgi:hypothetical protein
VFNDVLKNVSRREKVFNDVLKMSAEGKRCLMMC